MQSFLPIDILFEMLTPRALLLRFDKLETKKYFVRNKGMFCLFILLLCSNCKTMMVYLLENKFKTFGFSIHENAYQVGLAFVAY